MLAYLYVSEVEGGRMQRKEQGPLYRGPSEADKMRQVNDLQFFDIRTKLVSGLESTDDKLFIKAGKCLSCNDLEMGDANWNSWDHGWDPWDTGLSVSRADGVAS
jgi:hypothetical protein